MVRIHIKILAHDGLSRRDALWQHLIDIGAYVYRLIETREPLILVTDSSQAEKILKDEVRESLREGSGGSNTSRVCSP